MSRKKYYHEKQREQLRNNRTTQWLAELAHQETSGVIPILPVHFDTS
jgi:hypothetical protein